MKNTYIILVAFAFTWMCSCAKESDHSKEQGIALSIEATAPSDVISQVTVWLFSKTDNVLRQEYEFTTFSDLVSTLLPATAGKYDIVVVTNWASSFEHNATIGQTKLDELLLNIKSPLSSPQHLHYGKIKVEVSPTGITPLKLTVKRVLAQIQLTIRNLEPDTERISAEILNSSAGFYPATDKLSQNSSIVCLGEVALNGNAEIVFPTYRLMPVTSSIGMLGYDVKAEIKTLMRLTFKHKTGKQLSFQVEMPQIQNAGEYSVEISSAELRPEITLQITDINGWRNNTPIDGEILNPNK